MQWRIDPAQFTRRIWSDQRRNAIKIGVDQLLTEHRVGRGAWHVIQAVPRDLIDPRRDVSICWWHDLRAVAEIDLVAVVLRRIVRRGDHDARYAAQVQDAERHHRCRQRPGCDHDLKAGSRHDLGRVSGKKIRVASRIEADDHLAGSKAVIKKVAGESGGGLSDDDTIHAIRSRTERTAKPSRAELEPGGER